MENVIIIIILAGIVVGVVSYLYKAKKRGQTCIGCPHAKQCSGKCGGHEGHRQNKVRVSGDARS